jgi:hypothetical protein
MKQGSDRLPTVIFHGGKCRQAYGIVPSLLCWPVVKFDNRLTCDGYCRGEGSDVGLAGGLSIAVSNGYDAAGENVNGPVFHNPLTGY